MSDNDGIVGAYCTSCKQACLSDHLYDLMCHKQLHFREYYCKDCITKTWVGSDGNLVLCPSCFQDAEFFPLKPIQKYVFDDKFFLVAPGVEGFRLKPEIAGTLIGASREEAVHILLSIYGELVRALGPAALGACEPCAADCSCFGDTLRCTLRNPFLRFMREFWIDRDCRSKRCAGTPGDWETRLRSLLKSILLVRISQLGGVTGYFACASAKNETLKQQDAFVDGVVAVNRALREVKENWEVVIGLLLDALCWRHDQRLSTV